MARISSEKNLAGSPYPFDAFRGGDALKQSMLWAVVRVLPNFLHSLVYCGGLVLMHTDFH